MSRWDSEGLGVGVLERREGPNSHGKCGKPKGNYYVILGIIENTMETIGFSLVPYDGESNGKTIEMPWKLGPCT